MLRVGLTGNFGGGHREIMRLFKEAGTPIFDADLMVKWLLNHDKETIREIKNKFGDSSYSFGLINFYKFDDTKKIDSLLDVIEPHIFKKYNFFRMMKNKYAYTIFLSSILFEKKWNQNMNFTINVFKPQMIRKKDLKKSTTMHIDMIEFILKNEMCEFVKNSDSNFILPNYSEKVDKEKVLPQIVQIHSNLIRNLHNIDFIKTF